MRPAKGSWAFPGSRLRGCAAHQARLLVRHVSTSESAVVRRGHGWHLAAFNSLPPLVRTKLAPRDSGRRPRTSIFRAEQRPRQEGEPHSRRLRILWWAQTAAPTKRELGRGAVKGRKPNRPSRCLHPALPCRFRRARSTGPRTRAKRPFSSSRRASSLSAAFPRHQSRDQIRSKLNGHANLPWEANER
jgi:hypothetical protein